MGTPLKVILSLVYIAGSQAHMKVLVSMDTLKVILLIVYIVQTQWQTM